MNEEELLEHLKTNGIESYWQQEMLVNYADKLQTKYKKQKKINLEQNQFIDSLKTNIIKLQKENKELKDRVQNQFKMLSKFENYVDEETISLIYDEGE